MAGEGAREGGGAGRDAAAKARVLAREVSESKILKEIIGRTVGSCTMTAMIGRGGMGAVFKAFHTGIKREVAVKILPKSFNPDPERVRRFFREAESLGRLRHPNIVEIFNVGEEQSLYFIEMEFVEGADLDDLVKRGPQMPQDRILSIMKDICRGLKAAHDQSIIHRDLKPANILITPKGGVKIADFGVAKNLEKEEDLTVEGALIGTPQYMSPEQCRGEKLDRRSDIYSLGALFYFLVCGRRPFDSDNPMQVIMKHLKEDIQPPGRYNPAIDPSFNAIVERMMAKDPDDRYQSVEEVLEHLDDVANGRAVQYTSRRSKRRRLAAAASLLAAAALAVLIVYAATRPPAPKPGPPRRPPAPKQDGETAEGLKLLDLGKFDEAAAIFARAAASNPDSAGPARLLEISRGLAKALEFKRGGMYARALRTAEDLFGKGFWTNPGGEAPASAKSLALELDLRVGFDRLLAGGDLKKARAVLDEILGLDPGDSRAAADSKHVDALLAADGASAAGEVVSALRSIAGFAADSRFEPASAALTARLIKAAVAQARSMLESGDAGGASRTAADLASLCPDDPDVKALSAEVSRSASLDARFEDLLRNAEDAFGKGDFERAADLFGKAAEIRGDAALRAKKAEAGALGLERGAAAEQAAGRLEAACGLFAKAVEAARGLAGLEDRLAARFDSCRAEFRASLAKAARSALESGDAAAAGTAIEKGLKAFPGDPDLMDASVELRRMALRPEGMVYVKAGLYPVGREGEEGNAPRKAALGAFYVSKKEVTNDEFLEFVSARGYFEAKNWDPEGWKIAGTFTDREGRDRGPGNWFGGGPPPKSGGNPVTHVSWFEADAYARFRGMRLPSEEEWEVAASYDPSTGRQLLYPWGDVWKAGVGNLLAEGRDGAMAESGVFAGDVSPLGCGNMAGNAAEWTSSRWSADARLHVIRGTSATYENPALAARPSRRTQRADPARLRIAEVGFRTAKSAG